MPNVNDNKWNILNTPSSPSVGNDLNGAKIEKTVTGYKLVGVLATSDASNPPFTFPSFDYDGQTWTINVQSLPAGAGGNGTWSATPVGGDITGDPLDGDFTAQAGGGADEDAAEGASSAGA